MTQSLRVLVVGDSEDDYMLFLHELRRGGHSLESRRVETAEQMEAALDESGWDLVISDHAVPGCSAAAAVLLIKRRNLELPLMVVSGRVDDDTFVGLIKAGVSDVVLRQDLRRLLPMAELRIREARVRGELRGAGDELARERDFNKNLVEASPAFFTAVNPDGTIMMINEVMLRATGYTLDEVVGKSYVETFIPRREHDDMKGFRDDLVGRNREITAQSHVVAKDGRELVMEWRGRTMLKPDGSLDFVFGVGLDVTEREKAAQALRESQQLLKKTFSALPDAVFIIDLNTNLILDCNPASSNMFGYEGDEMIGRAVDFLHVSPESREEFRSNLYMAVRFKGRLERFEFRMRRKDGTIFPTEHYVNAFHDDKGRPIGWVGVVVDLTRRRKIEEELKRHQAHLESLVAERTRELREAQEELMRQDRLAVLGQMAGSIGHEILNPLGVIKNSTYYLGMMIEPSDEKTRRHLRIIEREIARTKKIVTDLLNLTHTGPRETRSADLARLLDEALEEVEVNGDITVKRSYQVGAPAVTCDPLQVKQVFLNLILNAVQAMKNGGDDNILGLFVRSGDGRVLVEVEDSGPGIPAENIGRIFDPLFTTKTVGFGIGLTVCRQLAGINGAEISVENCTGKGARFTVSFKGAAAVEESPP